MSLNIAENVTQLKKPLVHSSLFFICWAPKSSLYSTSSTFWSRGAWISPMVGPWTTWGWWERFVGGTCLDLAGCLSSDSFLYRTFAFSSWRFPDSSVQSQQDCLFPQGTLCLRSGTTSAVWGNSAADAEGHEIRDAFTARNLRDV